MARKSIAPWSERVSEGLIDQPIDSQIQASQTLRATVDTGFIDQDGTWKGIVSSDTIPIPGIEATGIANGGTILTPSANADGSWPLDMTGYTDIFIAFKVSTGGNFKIEAVMGPDSNSFGGLSPVNAAAVLKGTTLQGDFQLGQVLVDSAEALTNDVWNIFMIQGRLANQKLLQFKITNNSGDVSDIETAFFRIV
tara:strand:- start:278 stop:862 length:585 start_codon:yes stop_codon:yes gene_type:complete